MVMPLDLFITPYTDPTKIKRSGALGELGQSLQEQANFNNQFGERQRQFDATNALHGEQMRTENALRGEQIQGINRYHDDLIDARREESREKTKAAGEKRAAFLLDAFRKAKNAQEREAIRQELTRIGYSVEETETALPEVATPAAVTPADIITPQAMPKPAGKAPKGKKGQIQLGDVNIGPNDEPGFAEKLAGYMKEQPESAGPPGLGEPAGGGNVQDVLGALGIGMDPNQAGPPEEPAKAEAPSKPKRGGRYSIRDKEGNLASTWDEPVEMEKQRAFIRKSLSPYVGNEGNKEMSAAADRASQAGAAALAYLPPEKAMELARDEYDKEMARFKSERRPGARPAGGGGGVAGGISKEERLRRSAIDDDDLAVINSIGNRHAITDVNKNLGNITKMEDLLADAKNDGFKGSAALSTYMKDMSGLTVNREEVGRIIGGSGKLTELEFRLNQWGDKGRLPDDLREGLIAVAAASRKVAMDRLQRAGNSAYDYIMNKRGIYATPEEREQSARAARGYFTEDYSAAPSAPAHGRSGGGGGGGSSKPSGGASTPKPMDPSKRNAIEEGRRLLQGGT